MKKGLLLLLLGIITSCSDDDKIKIATDLNGKWAMVSYVSFSPSLPEINKGDIIWTFDLTSNKLEIVNRIESEYPYILPSGEYDISVANDMVTISTVEYNYYISDDNKLIVSNNPELDGPLMTFIPR